MGAEELQTSALAGTGYLIVVQIVSRIATFVINNAIHRILPLAATGIASDMELYFGFVLFLARDTIRLAVLRRNPDSKVRNEEGKKNENEIPTSVFTSLNLSCISIILGILLSFIFISQSYFLYYRNLNQIVNESFNNSSFWILLFQNYGRLLVLSIYLLSAIIECFCEPSFSLLSIYMLFKTRAKIESIALFVKCFITLISAYSIKYIPVDIIKDNIAVLELYGALGFALGQLSHSIILCISYSYYVYRNPKDEPLIKIKRKLKDNFSFSKSLYPHSIKIYNKKKEVNECIYIDNDQINTAFSFAGQSLAKHLLTEADKLALLWIGTSNENKGTYRLVSDMGSLVVRIIFAPLEETTRTYLSNSILSINSNETLMSYKTKVFNVMDFYNVLLTLYSVLGIFILSYGTLFTKQITWILYGYSRANSNEFIEALKIYCIYIPILGVNGITESFVHSLGNIKTITKQSLWLIFCSFGFITTCLISNKYFNFSGSSSIIIANIVNMLLRIIFSINFIQQLFNFKTNELKDILQTVSLNENKSKNTEEIQKENLEITNYFKLKLSMKSLLLNKYFYMIVFLSRYLCYKIANLFIFNINSHNNKLSYNLIYFSIGICFGFLNLIILYKMLPSSFLHNLYKVFKS